MEPLWEEIVRLQESGGRAALATVVWSQGSAPRHPGARMLVFPDGRTVGTIGGGGLEARVISESQEVLSLGEPRLVRVELTDDDPAGPGLVCGGAVQVFIEPLGTEWVLVVFGAGHVAQPLVRLARRVGLRVIVADDRADYANRDRFPDAEQVLVDDLGRLARTIELGPSSYVVIVTRGHEHDREVLAHVIARNPGYIGMIGSRAKVARVFADLRKQGVLDDRLEAVHAPIGLDVGAETPEEIAVSIIAEILCVKNGRPGGFLNPGHSP